MKTGMLWFDNNNKIDLKTKIIKASDYYREKYGQAPELCFVHPSMLVDKLKKAQGVAVVPSQKVLPNHLWLGLNGSKTQSNKAAR